MVYNIPKQKSYHFQFFLTNLISFSITQSPDSIVRCLIIKIIADPLNQFDNLQVQKLQITSFARNFITKIWNKHQIV